MTESSNFNLRKMSYTKSRRDAFESTREEVKEHESPRAAAREGGRWCHGAGSEPERRLSGSERPIDLGLTI